MGHVTTGVPDGLKTRLIQVDTASVRLLMIAFASFSTLLGGGLLAVGVSHFGQEQVLPRWAGWPTTEALVGQAKRESATARL